MQVINSHQHLLFVFDCHLIRYQPLFNLLGPSSLIHSLQIYCTRLAKPRSHTPWAWAAKWVLTIGVVCGKNLCNSECNGHPWQDQVPVNKNPCIPSNKMTSLTSNASETRKVVYMPHILAEVTLELEVTSLRNRTTEPCKGRMTI